MATGFRDTPIAMADAAAHALEGMVDQPTALKCGEGRPRAQMLRQAIKAVARLCLFRVGQVVNKSQHTKLGRGKLDWPLVHPRHVAWLHRRRQPRKRTCDRWAPRPSGLPEGGDGASM
jgi:hypothetical protein